MDEDQIRDIAIRIVDALVKEGIIPNCIDTDDQSEFTAQDCIVAELTTNQTLGG